MSCATSEFAVVLPGKDRAINRAGVFLEAGVNLALYLRPSTSSALHYFMKPTKIFGISFGEWNAMSFYGRFEQIVTWILTLFIAAIFSDLS